MPYRPAWVYKRNQLSLPFPTQLSVVPPRGGISVTILERQPSRFPPGWWRLEREHGPNWRDMHYDRWVAKRKAMGLPHVIHDPLYRASGEGKVA